MKKIITFLLIANFAQAQLPAIISGRQLVANYQTGGTLNCVTWIDAANKQCYPRTGTTITPLGNYGQDNYTMTNGASYNSAGYFSFDGVNDYLSCSDATSDMSVINISVQFWVKIKSNAANQWFMSKYDNATPNSGWNFWWDKTTTKFHVGGRESAAAFLSCSTDSTYAINTWWNVCWTKSANTWKLYVNGVLNKTSTLGNGTTSFGKNDVYVGAYKGAVFANCDIAHILFYRVAISATDVLYNYQITKNRFQ